MSASDVTPTDAASAGEKSDTLTPGHHVVRRLRFFCAMAVAGVIFWHFGWWVARPLDAQSAVSLLTLENGVIAMAELIGLAVVVSGLATAICGAGAAERGPLAVAVGLATLAARGGRMDMLLLQRISHVSVNKSLEVYPVASLVAETFLWLALIGVGLVVGRAVEGWYAADRSTPEAGKEEAAPGIRECCGALVVGCVVAWFALTFAAGSDDQPIRVGQLYFALVMAFLFAALIGQWFFEVSNRTLMLAVVGIVAFAGYWYGEPSNLSMATELGTYLPVDKPVARPLPIEYAALGAIGVFLEADFIGVLYVIVGYQPHKPEAGAKDAEAKSAKA